MNTAKKLPTLPATHKCPGEAHSPEVGGMIDNCSRCAPEWGLVPAYKALSSSAYWLLRTLSQIPSSSRFIHLSNAPQEVLDASNELRTEGLVTFTDRTDSLKKKSSVTYLVIIPTDLGNDSILHMNANHR